MGRRLALEFYAPFYLLVSMSDASPGSEAETQMLSAHIENFIERQGA